MIILYCTQVSTVPMAWELFYSKMVYVAYRHPTRSMPRCLVNKRLG